MKKNIKDLCKNIECHFSKHKTFYMSILISLIIVFIWCKWGKIIFKKVMKNNDEILDNNLINNNNKYYNQKILNEINNILVKIN